MSKKKDHSEKQVEKPEKTPRRRFSPFTRVFIVMGLILIAWLLAGTALQWFVQSALASRELSRAAGLSRTASYLQPWDSDLNLAPARCARLAGDLESWSKQMQPLAPNAATHSAVARELQLGRIQLGEFPDDFHGLMGKMLDSTSSGEVAEVFVIGLMAKHDRENARAILDAWKKDEPTNPQVKYVEAVYEELLDNRREALARLVQFSADHPTHQPARLRLAKIYLSDRHYGSALAELKILAAQGDRSSATLVMLARCYRLQGEVEAAKNLLASLAPIKTEAAALRELADCQLELGEYAAAAQSLRDFGIERLPPAEQSDLALADYLSGKPETAALIYANSTKTRQFQSRRADLEVYLILNPNDEKARRELQTLNGQK